MALPLITKLNSNVMTNKLRESLLFVLPVALLSAFLLNIYMFATGTTVSGFNDGSVLYMYYELFLATFGARNIETD